MLTFLYASLIDNFVAYKYNNSDNVFYYKALMAICKGISPCSHELEIKFVIHA